MGRVLVSILRYAFLIIALLAFSLPLIMGLLLSAQSGEGVSMQIWTEVWYIGMFHAAALFAFVFGSGFLLLTARRSKGSTAQVWSWQVILIVIACVTSFYLINANVDNYSALSMFIILGGFVLLSFGLRGKSKNVTQFQCDDMEL